MLAHADSAQGLIQEFSLLSFLFASETTGLTLTTSWEAREQRPGTLSWILPGSTQNRFRSNLSWAEEAGGGDFSLTPPGVNESRDPTFILCSLSNLDSALEKGGGDFGGELFSSRLLSRLVYLIDIIMINWSWWPRWWSWWPVCLKLWKCLLTCLKVPLCRNRIRSQRRNCLQRIL